MRTVLCVGGVAVGFKSASRFKRLEPDARVIVVDQSALVSYAGCGIPYYISGKVGHIDDLRGGAEGPVRDVDYFKERGIEVRTQTRAVAIDRKAKTVLLEQLTTGERETVAYDALVLGTGSVARMPSVAGHDLKGVTGANRLEEAVAIREACLSGRVHNAVIVGGGFIGMEMAVALRSFGISVTVIEFASEPLASVLSPKLSAMARQDSLDHGVHVFTDEKVERLEGQNGHVTRVITSKQELPADLVVFAVGFAPDTTLAREAGLALDPRNQAILVDAFMRTSDPLIYAGGDCAAVRHLVTGKPATVALGSLANRQGRVIGDNLAGGHSRFFGVLGTWVMELFALTFGGLGLTLDRARAEGLDAVSVLVEQADHAAYYSQKSPMHLELVAEVGTRRVLGLQGASVNGEGLKARIDAMAGLMQGRGEIGASVEDVANLEVAYTPLFAAAIDVINTAGNVMDNALSKPKTEQ